MGVGRKLPYIAWSLLVLTLAYVVPYTLLAGVKGMELYCFWLALAVIHIIVSYVYVRFGGDDSWTRP